MVISAALIVCRQHNIVPQPVAFDLFASFIFLCGLSHLVKTVTIYTGVYRLDVLVVVATAVVSAGTAIYTLIGALSASRV